MESRSRQRAVERVVRISGDDSIDAIATFRLHPLFAYASRLAVTVAAIVNLATGAWWARVLVLALVVVHLVAPDRTITVAAGPERAVFAQSTGWLRHRRDAFVPLDPMQIGHVAGIRWDVAGRRLWAWGEGGSLLRRVAAQTASR